MTIEAIARKMRDGDHAPAFDADGPGIEGGLEDSDLEDDDPSGLGRLGAVDGADAADAPAGRPR